MHALGILGLQGHHGIIDLLSGHAAVDFIIISGQLVVIEIVVGQGIVVVLEIIRTQVHGRQLVVAGGVGAIEVVQNLPGPGGIVLGVDQLKIVASKDILAQAGGVAVKAHGKAGAIPERAVANRSHACVENHFEQRTVACEAVVTYGSDTVEIDADDPVGIGIPGIILGAGLGRHRNFFTVKFQSSVFPQSPLDITVVADPKMADPPEPLQGAAKVPVKDAVPAGIAVMTDHGSLYAGKGIGRDGNGRAVEPDLVKIAATGECVFANGGQTFFTFNGLDILIACESIGADRAGLNVHMGKQILEFEPGVFLCAGPNGHLTVTTDIQITILGNSPLADIIQSAAGHVVNTARENSLGDGFYQPIALIIQPDLPGGLTGMMVIDQGIQIDFLGCVGMEGNHGQQHAESDQ